MRTPALTVAHVAHRLAARRAPTPSRLWARCAVAMLLRDGERLEVLLMRRALRDGDRWSGHVSLPGGAEDARDRDLVDTAVRETREEVGVELARSARLIGQLPPAWALTRGVPRPMTVTPVVFAVAGPIEIALGAEATHAFWFPLGAAATGALDGTHPYRIGPLRRSLPCWRYQGEEVWGLTFEMLRRLIAL